MTSQVSSYILDEQIGAGAMGVVYSAHHVRTGERVALKLIAPGFSSNDLLAARFEREMSIVQKLEHPNIVKCFSSGGTGKQRFFTMELVEGGSIASLLERRGRLSWQECITYALQVCSALECAHAQGIIHRDIKPVNLLLSKDGALKLGDFGLALDPDATALTAAGKTVGTVNYMAPEQIRGRPGVSPQTDLYALGCVLFEMLTGRPPFEADSPGEVLFHHLSSRPVRVTSLALDCPVWLERLVSKLLEKDPLQRPPDARAVSQELRRIRERAARGAATVAKSPSGSIPKKLESRTGFGSSTVLRRVRRQRGRRRLSRRPLVLGTCLFVTCLALGWSTWQAFHRVNDAALHLWGEALKHSDETVRAEAARSLGQIGSDAAQFVPVLTAALEDPRVRVRAEAASALGRIGPAALPAVPTLVRLSKSDEDLAVRERATAAVNGLRASGGAGSRVLAAVTGVGVLVAGALGLMWAGRRFGPTAVPLLIEDLKHQRVTVRRRAARILALIGPPARAAVPALLQALKDGDESVRRNADLALGKVGLQNKSALPDLAAALGDKDPFVRTRAAAYLGKLGPAARPAIPALIGVLKDPIDLVRVEAVEALGHIDAEAGLVGPHLTAALRDKSYSVRQAAASVLKKYKLPHKTG